MCLCVSESEPERELVGLVLLLGEDNWRMTT